MIETLKQRNFALLWVAGFISMIGDWVLFIGLPVYIYKVTGSTLATGAMTIASTLPALAFGSIAGVFVDRWDRRRTMIITNLLQAGALLPLILVQSLDQLWIVYIVLFVESLLSQFFNPAERALLPLLVDDTHLASANSLNAMNNNLSRLIGPALGGLIVATSGLIGITLIDIVSFFIAAALIVLVATQRKPQETSAKSSTLVEAFLKVGRELREGLQFVRNAPSLSTLFFIGTMTMIGEGFFMTLMVPFVVKVMKGTEADFGYLMTAQAIGGIIGSLFVARIAKNIPAHRLFGVCAIIFGLCDLALFYSPMVFTGVTAGLVIIALVGVPAVGIGTGLTTLLQKLTVDSYRGRVFGVYGTLVALLGLIGAAIAGVLGEHINLMVLLTIQGLVYIVAGGLALVLLQRTAQPVAMATPAVEIG